MLSVGGAAPDPIPFKSIPAFRHNVKLLSMMEISLLMTAAVLAIPVLKVRNEFAWIFATKTKPKLFVEPAAPVAEVVREPITLPGMVENPAEPNTDPKNGAMTF